MQASAVTQKLKEYESFCKDPNFLDAVKAKKAFTLHIILSRDNLKDYAKNKEYAGLIPESNIIIALIGLEKDGLIECEDSKGHRGIEYIADLQGIELKIKIDRDRVPEIAGLLGSFSQSYLAYLKNRRKEENQARLLRIAESKERQIELQKTVDELGGLVFDGLYHGGRRVKARVASNGREWQLSDDEVDLVSALGKGRIRKGMNRADLFNKYGLREEREIAPVTFSIDECGYQKIERLDNWGE